MRIAHSCVHIIDIKNYTLNHSRPYALRGADGWKIRVSIKVTIIIDEAHIYSLNL